MIYTVTLNPSLDRTLFFSRLMLGQLNRAHQVRLDVGGKGFNVSRALLALGVRSVALGFTAGAAGEYLQRGLGVLGIETDLVQLSGETRANLTVVEESTGVITKLNEPGPQVSEAHVEVLLNRIRWRAAKGDVWIMSGSVPPGAPADIYARMVEIVHGVGGGAFLDSSGPPLREGCRAAPYGVKPNVEEAAQALGRPLRSEEELQGAIEGLLEMGIQLVALSRGARGALVGSQEGIVWAMPPPSVVVKSPIGAGDALLAGLVFAVKSGLDLESVARWGVAAGTAAAMQEGTGVGDRKQVEGLVREVRPQWICSGSSHDRKGLLGVDEGQSDQP